MAIDCHVHTQGGEDGGKVLKAMDKAKLERMVLFAVPPHRGLEPGAIPPSDAHRQSIDEIARLCEADPDRMIAFAWIEPTLPDALEAIDYAFGEKNLHGVKMIPNHWYPADEPVQICYQRIQQYEKPMLFHTGILWGLSDTSQYCRPAFYEIMLHYPGIRFAMAHISWPWTDECFAVNGKFKQNQQGEWTSYIDITSGAPRIWKVEAMQKGLAYLGDEHFLYGSDCSEPENAASLKQHLEWDREILRDAGASPETIERLLSANALKWLGIE